MENLEKLTIMGTQDKEQRQTKHKNTTQEANKMRNTHPTQNGGESGACEG
jgi:hypothetical protein